MLRHPFELAYEERRQTGVVHFRDVLFERFRQLLRRYIPKGGHVYTVSPAGRRLLEEPPKEWA
jgi:hypothetical protein